MSNKRPKAAAKKAAASKSKSALRAAEIAKQHGVDTVYENPNGEFFTKENLALLSVDGDRKKLSIHRPSIIQDKAPEADPEQDDTDTASGTDTPTATATDSGNETDPGNEQ